MTGKELTRNTGSFNSYKLDVLLMGHRQTVQPQMGHRRTDDTADQGIPSVLWCPIFGYSVCLDKFH